jgi:hypothetical protein
MSRNVAAHLALAHAFVTMRFAIPGLSHQNKMILVM